MRVIVAGSRAIEDTGLVYKVIESAGFRITEIVSGGAQGVDRAGEIYAQANNIPIARFPAHWKTYGKKAGMIRNEEMARYADGLIAIWDMQSAGTRQMINMAYKYRLIMLMYPVTS